MFLRFLIAAAIPASNTPNPTAAVLDVSLPVLAKRLTCALGVAAVTFLKMWRTFPFSSTTVLTNSYPSNVPSPLAPFSDGFNGFPFSSVHVVMMFVAGIRVDFLKMWRTFPSTSTTVLTNSYPSNVPLPLAPFSDGFNGFPFSSVHVVITATGVGVVTFSYTCSVSPFGSFLVSTNLYPGISFLGVVPSSVGFPGISFPSLSLNEVLTFS